jgi:hypothetical protein
VLLSGAWILFERVVAVHFFGVLLLIKSCYFNDLF